MQDMAKKTAQLPKVLRRLMETKTISARALAKATGIPASTISTFLSGTKKSYDVQHLAVLADFFKVSVDHLLFDSKVTPKNFDLLKADEVFKGLLRVRIERIIPDDENEGES